VPSCSPEKFNLADNLDGWITAAKPDVVLLLIGVNDMIPQSVPAGTSGLRRPVRPGDAPAKLVALIQRIRTLQPGVRLVVASLVPTDLDRRWPDAVRVRRTLKDLAAADKSGKTGFADLAQVSLGAGDYVDPIHLTASGADKVAQVWFEAMRTVLDSAGQDTAPVSASNTTTSAQQTSPKRTSKPKATAKAKTSTTLKRG
jgi:lysophospholipase L1-like esterase